jgi:ABC-type multidrug transport system permease subunit
MGWYRLSRPHRGQPVLQSTKDKSGSLYAWGCIVLRPPVQRSLGSRRNDSGIRKPILLKHKTFSFYRPAAYAVAQTVVDIPLVFIQVVIFNLIIYFMAGLGRTPSQFFISILFLWIVTMTMYAFFRGIAAVSKSLDSATRVTGIAIQALVVYTGYLIPPTKMVSTGGLSRAHLLTYHSIPGSNGSYGSIPSNTDSRL